MKVFILTPSLRPANYSAKIYIIDPRGSRIAQWQSERPQMQGIISKTFPLTEEPVYGEWKIFAEVQSHLYNKSIHIQHYRYGHNNIYYGYYISVRVKEDYLFDPKLLYFHIYDQ